MLSINSQTLCYGQSLSDCPQALLLTASPIQLLFFSGTKNSFDVENRWYAAFRLTSFHSNLALANNM
jgi:hypothetical protein